MNEVIKYDFLLLHLWAVYTYMQALREINTETGCKALLLPSD